MYYKYIKLNEYMINNIVFTQYIYIKFKYS